MHIIQQLRKKNHTTKISKQKLFIKLEIRDCSQKKKEKKKKR